MDTHISVEAVPMLFHVVMYVIGIANLLPWNFFITAETYWDYKLRNVSQGEAWDDQDSDSMPLQIAFMPTLSIVSNVVSTVFFFVTSGIVSRVSESVRMYGSLVLSLAFMVLITIFCVVDTDQWQLGFYVITMVAAGVLSMCMAVSQGSASGLAGMFPSACMASLMSGQAIAGIFSSLARIFSLLVGEEPYLSGLIYFIISDVFLVITIAGYYYIRRMPYYRRVHIEVNSSSSAGRVEREEKLITSAVVKRDLKAYRRVFMKIWPMGLTLGLALFITLAVFPSVVVYITSTLPESRWTKDFFQPTITFLLFNVGDLLGREVTRWLKWPGPRGWGIHLLGAARLVFVPLLMLCYGTNKTFPTIFNHDAYYIIINLLFSLSNGYIVTLMFIYYQEYVEKDELEMGGAIMVAVMGLGLVLGSLISPGLVALWGPD